MADNDKTSQIKLDFLNTLYNLILSEDIKEEERRVLTKAKNLVEKGEYIPNVIRRMQTNFTLHAINSNLSPSFIVHCLKYLQRFYQHFQVLALV